jgi:hypothetical protein
MLSHNANGTVNLHIGNTLHQDLPVGLALDKLTDAIKFVSDRLTAWAEHHEARARSMPDSEAMADVNIAANYRALLARL